MRFSRNPVSDQLATMRVEAEKRDAMRRANAEKLPYYNNEPPPEQDALMLVPEEDAKAGRLAVVANKDGTLTVAVMSLKNTKAREVVESLKQQGFSVVAAIAALRTLEMLWQGYTPIVDESAKSRKQITSRVELDSSHIEEIRDKVKSASDVAAFFEKLGENVEISTLLAYILGAALAVRASDVHIEYMAESETLLRFRIDGALRDIIRLKGKTTRLLVSRVKLLAGLKLNITDAPQDGRFTIGSAAGDIEVRSSVVPAEFGEAIVMRVLDPGIVALKLGEIGLREDDGAVIENELKRPNGMILVTGPTGSGKTTTLYAFLKKVQSPEIKVITIEDPIEYHLTGIEQTQTDEASGYTFATGLRSVLRQDPDVILVGEIRDAETANVSINAALTGHLVFSTLHTNNAAGAVPRLIDLGVRQSTIGPAVTLIIAQRLVRRLCTTCRKKTEVSERLQKDIEKFLKDLPERVSRDSMKTELYEAVGCPECEDGFKGRIAIFELLQMDDTMDTLIREKATERDIRETAIKEQEMVLIQQDGLVKALQGITTLGEVERVTGPLEW